MTVLIECFDMQNESLVNRVQDMTQRIINRGVLIRFLGNSHIYQTPETNCFIAARATGAHEVLFNV